MSKNPTKITVVEVITHMPLGGAQRTALELADRLPEYGIHKTYLLSGPGGDMSTEAKHRLGSRFITAPHLKREISPTSDLLALFELRNGFKKIMNDNKDAHIIVHTHAPKAGVIGNWAAWLAGVKHRVHTLHGLPFNRSQSKIARAAYIMFAKAGQMAATYTVSVCESNTQIAQRYNMVESNKLTHIMPVLLEPRIEQSKEDLRNKLGLPQDATVITMVASLKPPKDIAGFIQTAKIVLSQTNGKNFFFVLVGGGVLEDWARSEVKRLSIQENFLITGWRVDAIEFIAASDINVLLSFGEGLPLVIAEAGLLNVPSVASDVGCSAIAASKSGGFAVPVGDYELAANKIIELASKIKKEKISADKTYFEEFLPHKVVPRYAELFLSLGGGSR